MPNRAARRPVNLRAQGEVHGEREHRLDPARMYPAPVCSAAVGVHRAQVAVPSWLHALVGLLVIASSLMVPARVQAATISYVYDGLGRPVGVVDPAPETAVYRYDAVGNVPSISRSASGA